MLYSLNFKSIKPTTSVLEQAKWQKNGATGKSNCFVKLCKESHSFVIETQFHSWKGFSAVENNWRNLQGPHWGKNAALKIITPVGNEDVIEKICVYKTLQLVSHFKPEYNPFPLCM